MPITPAQYLNKIKPLRNPEEIETVCNELTASLFNQSDKPKTRVNKLTPYNKAVNEGFISEELIEGQNAYIQTKADGSLWKRHLHFKFTGLADTKWNGEGGINTKTIVLDRLENKRKVDVHRYLETTLRLLQSENPHEIVVGLIAASGRRPVEILARGSFTLVDDNQLPKYLKPGYFVNFKGQAKKRDYDITEEERTEYRIGLLVPAKFFIEQFERFKALPEAQEIAQFLESENGKGTDPEIINDGIEGKRGNSLRRVVRREFSSFLPARFGDTQIDNKSLRAVYVRLITERDCPKNIDGLLWASRAVGHFVDEQKPDDSQLRHLSTTLGYSDYYIEGTVPFTATPDNSPEKVQAVRAYLSDATVIDNLKGELNLPNQQQVIHKLLRFFEENKHLALKLRQTESTVSELEKEIEMLRTSQGQNININEKLAQMKADIVAELKQSLATEQKPVAETAQQKPETNQAIIESEIVPDDELETTTESEKIDWESVPTAELKKKRGKNAINEKIRRVFMKIQEYNDYKAASNDERWLISNQLLREITGCNGQDVSKWIKHHQQVIDDHNKKYGMTISQNKKHKDIDAKTFEPFIW